jgi:hypothetical protein
MGDQISDSTVDILQKARVAVLGDRVRTHGSFYENMQMATKIFNAWTGVNLTPVEGCMFLQCLKMAREAAHPAEEDHMVDQAGYLLLRSQLYECDKKEHQ